MISLKIKFCIQFIMFKVSFAAVAAFATASSLESEVESTIEASQRINNAYVTQERNLRRSDVYAAKAISTGNDILRESKVLDTRTRQVQRAAINV